MMIHDIIKINLSREGYLPDYPPHLISDEEMCHAFISHKSTNRGIIDWFHSNYPVPERFVIGATTDADPHKVYSDDAYHALEAEIYDTVQEFIADTDPDKKLPDWIYAYMMGVVVGPYSDVEDRHNMLALMGLDNKDDELTPEVYRACYRVSKLWLSKSNSTDRHPHVPTIYIEPHVVKYYRLRADM